MLSGLGVHIASSCPVSHPPVHPVPSPQGCSQFIYLTSHISQYVLTLVIILTQVQHLALGLVKLNEVHIGAPLQPVTVPLDGISSLQHINCTIQLGDICKFAGGTLNPTVYVVD